MDLKCSGEWQRIHQNLNREIVGSGTVPPRTQQRGRVFLPPKPSAQTQTEADTTHAVCDGEWQRTQQSLNREIVCSGFASQHLICFNSHSCASHDPPVSSSGASIQSMGNVGNMFAGSSRLADLMHRGAIQQNQLDERISHLNNAEAGRKRPSTSIHQSGVSEHRPKQYKSKPFRDAQGSQASLALPERKRKREEDEFIFTRNVI